MILICLVFNLLPMFNKIKYVCVNSYLSDAQSMNLLALEDLKEMKKLLPFSMTLK